MPYCAYCGTEVVVGMAACPECGHPQSAQSFAASSATGKNEPYAVASLALGILGLAFVCPVVGSVAAIVLGLLAQRRIERDPTKGGKGLATAGLVTGALGVVIVPVLFAIAIPTFIGARVRAQDRAATATLDSGLQTAVSIASQSRTYRAVTIQSIAVSGSRFAWTPNGASTGPFIVSYTIVDDTEIRIAVRSLSGTCFSVRDDVDGGGVAYAKHEDATSCGAASFSSNEFTSTLPLTRT